MSVMIFDWKDKRAMLECLADSIHDFRLYVLRDIEPNFPEFSEELSGVRDDLSAIYEKLYTIMERSLAKDAEDLDV